MGSIEPLAIAAALPYGVMPFGASVLLWAPLMGILVLAAVGLWSVRPRRKRPLPALRVAHVSAS